MEKNNPIINQLVDYYQQENKDPSDILFAIIHELKQRKLDFEQNSKIFLRLYNFAIDLEEGHIKI